MGRWTTHPRKTRTRPRTARDGRLSMAERDELEAALTPQAGPLGDPGATNLPERLENAVRRLYDDHRRQLRAAPIESACT
jgi:hypothetical protein